MVVRNSTVQNIGLHIKVDENEFQMIIMFFHWNTGHLDAINQVGVFPPHEYKNDVI